MASRLWSSRTEGENFPQSSTWPRDSELLELQEQDKTSNSLKCRKSSEDITAVSFKTLSSAAIAKFRNAWAAAGLSFFGSYSAEHIPHMSKSNTTQSETEN